MIRRARTAAPPRRGYALLRVPLVALVGAMALVGPAVTAAAEPASCVNIHPPDCDCQTCVPPEIPSIEEMEQGIPGEPDDPCTGGCEPFEPGPCPGCSPDPGSCPGCPGDDPCRPRGCPPPDAQECPGCPEPDPTPCPDCPGHDDSCDQDACDIGDWPLLPPSIEPSVALVAPVEPELGMFEVDVNAVPSTIGSVVAPPRIEPPRPSEVAPQRPSDKPFLMPVEDVFSITGRGTAVTGRAETVTTEGPPRIVEPPADPLAPVRDLSPVTGPYDIVAVIEAPTVEDVGSLVVERATRAEESASNGDAGSQGGTAL